MKILLTNDDGYQSIGIKVMAEHLLAAGHDVLLVAPHIERSGCGHAMTIGAPVVLDEVNLGLASDKLRAYSCTGTPTDCVVMGFDVLDSSIEMVISGINQGPNLADDITYSGTACAAMEGVIFDRPAIAVSLNSRSKDPEKHNETAAEIVLSVLAWIRENPMRTGVFYNVNVPNVPKNELAGVQVTKKGIRRYVDKITAGETADGKPAYWIGGVIEDEMTEGTDVWSIAHGYASITPVHMEMTSFTAYEENERKGMGEKLTAALFRK